MEFQGHKTNSLQGSIATESELFRIMASPKWMKSLKRLSKREGTLVCLEGIFTIGANFITSPHTLFAAVCSAFCSSSETFQNPFNCRASWSSPRDAEKVHSSMKICCKRRFRLAPFHSPLSFLESFHSPHDSDGYKESDACSVAYTDSANLLRRMWTGADYLAGASVSAFPFHCMYATGSVGYDCTWTVITISEI